MKKNGLLILFLAFLSFAQIFGKSEFRYVWQKSNLFCYSKQVNQTNERNAFHEAGHALMANLVGFKIKKATINPKGDAAGYVNFSYHEDKLDELIMVDLAGYVAEELTFKKACYGVRDDLDKATQICFDLKGNGGYNFLQKQLDKTRSIIYQNQDKLNNIARKLKKNLTLSGKNIENIIRDTNMSQVA
ncbi:hypothetical protein K9L05_00240 [Candidatus Babeliales bacterium]|nr:hypothetical protein [Candidatus Babeliales bacterium]MCF7899065.1 hypothetical protein [Candidatus Babeliales bacterium]